MTLLVLGFVLALLPAVVVWGWASRARNTANARAGLLAATEWLNDESQRAMRAQLWDMHRLGTNVPSNDMYGPTADKVGRVFQTIGYYVKHRFVPGDVVIYNWGQEILSTWDACRPWAEYRREDEEDPSVWADFEWLAKESLIKYQPSTGDANA
ncbi:MAG: hypothetical protein ABI658_13775 [Acidimicrobiales bacterium]